MKHFPRSYWIIQKTRWHFIPWICKLGTYIQYWRLRWKNCVERSIRHFNYSHWVQQTRVETKYPFFIFAKIKNKQIRSLFHFSRKFIFLWKFAKIFVFTKRFCFHKKFLQYFCKNVLCEKLQILRKILFQNWLYFSYVYWKKTFNVHFFAKVFTKIFVEFFWKKLKLFAKFSRK
jgi:hypothetical protein